MGMEEMDFTSETLGEALDSDAFAAARAGYKLYGVLLATSRDRNLMPDLLTRFPELHDVTDKSVLLIAPSLTGTNAQRDWFVDRIRDALATEAGLKSSASEVQHFLKRQQDQSYRFAEFIKLDPSELPVIVFFDRLRGPHRYQVWSLKDLTPDDVVDDLRAIVGALWEDERQPGGGTALEKTPSIGGGPLPRMVSKIITVDLPKAPG
jgi:hypothetical protein